LFQDIFKQLKKKNSQSDRGSAQLYAGYAYLNQKLDNIHTVTAPQITLSMNAWYAKKMVDYTSLIRVLCSEFNVPMPYSNNPLRTADWSQRLCEVFEVNGVNLIEQLTFALTCLDDDTNMAPLFFGSRVDQLNDQHWPQVLCIYNHFFMDILRLRLNSSILVLPSSKITIRTSKITYLGHYVLFSHIMCSFENICVFWSSLLYSKETVLSVKAP
jgi:hypothetical protein